jgi:hypothetical protein
MAYNTREVDVAALISDKQWNLHMLRKCARELSNLNKKDFKIKRFIAYSSGNSPLEKTILIQLIIDRSKLLTESEWPAFYSKLQAYEAKCKFHPRNKFNL